MVTQHIDDVTGIVDSNSSELADLTKLARQTSPAVVQNLLHGLMSAESRIRNFLNKRVFIEVTLLRVMRDAHALTVDDVVERLRRLSKVDDIEIPASSEVPVADNLSSDGYSKTTARSGDDARGQERINKLEMYETSDDKTGIQTQDGPTAYSADKPKYEREKELLAAAENPECSSSGGDREAVVAQADGQVDAVGDPMSIWHAMIEEVGKVPGKTSVQMHMKEMKPVSFQDGVLTIGLTDEFPDDHGKDIQRFEVEQLLRRTLQRVARNPDAEIVMTTINENFSSTEMNGRRRLSSSPDVWKSIEENDFVQLVCRLFNGKIIDVRG